MVPKMCRQYVDDTYAWFKSKEQSREFQKILNKQDKHIQFTIEKCLKKKKKKIKMGDMNLMFITNQL